MDFAMPATAARWRSVLSALGVAVTMASSRSENLAKSDHVLPVNAGAADGSAPSLAPCFFASVTTLVRAPVRSVSEVGLSTWRSMSTWYGASAGLYAVVGGRGLRRHCGG